jgi:hypothetical protein
LRDYVEELGERARRASEQLRTRGADGVVRDVRSLARRRPGAFLAGAAAAGFVVGRLVKAQRANANDDRSSSSNGRREWTPDVPVYGAAPTPAAEIPTQLYPTPGLEEYTAGVVGNSGNVETIGPERRS